MDSLGDQPTRHYYNVLGLGNNASACAIRTAYKKLAMKWHPDKCSGQNRAEAKVKFQEIQQAYAVLSDERKKFLYDNGLFDPDDDDEDIEVDNMPWLFGNNIIRELIFRHLRFLKNDSIMKFCRLLQQGFTSFMNEMSDIMTDLQASEDSSQKGSSFEELQELFVSMFSADLAAFNNPMSPSSANPINLNMNKGWGGG